MINRGALYMVIHLLGHMDAREKQAVPYWNLTCGHLPWGNPSSMNLRKNVHQSGLPEKPSQKLKLRSTEGIISRFQDMVNRREYEGTWQRDFILDNHGKQLGEEEDPGIPPERQNKLAE